MPNKINAGKSRIRMRHLNGTFSAHSSDAEPLHGKARVCHQVAEFEQEMLPNSSSLRRFCYWWCRVQMNSKTTEPKSIRFTPSGLPSRICQPSFRWWVAQILEPASPIKSRMLQPTMLGPLLYGTPRKEAFTEPSVSGNRTSCRFSFKRNVNLHAFNCSSFDAKTGNGGD